MWVGLMQSVEDHKRQSPRSPEETPDCSGTQAATLPRVSSLLSCLTDFARASPDHCTSQSLKSLFLYTHTHIPCKFGFSQVSDKPTTSGTQNLFSLCGAAAAGETLLWSCRSRQTHGGYLFVFCHCLVPTSASHLFTVPSFKVGIFLLRLT